MKKNTAIEIISALLILLFTYTAMSKLFERSLFEHTLSTSPLIGSYSSILVWALPITEVIVGLLLFFHKTRSIGLYASGILMGIFTIYLAYMIVFASKLPCSCGGVIRRMTWEQHLIFNIFFLALALIGIFLDRINKKEIFLNSTSDLKANLSL